MIFFNVGVDLKLQGGWDSDDFDYELLEDYRLDKRDVYEQGLKDLQEERANFDLDEDYENWVAWTLLSDNMKKDIEKDKPLITSAVIVKDLQKKGITEITDDQAGSLKVFSEEFAKGKSQERPEDFLDALFFRRSNNPVFKAEELKRQDSNLYAQRCQEAMQDYFKASEHWNDRNYADGFLDDREGRDHCEAWNLFCKLTGHPDDQIVILDGYFSENFALDGMPDEKRLAAAKALCAEFAKTGVNLSEEKALKAVNDVIDTYIDGDEPGEGIAYINSYEDLLEWNNNLYADLDPDGEVCFSKYWSDAAHVHWDVNNDKVSPLEQEFYLMLQDESFTKQLSDDVREDYKQAYSMLLKNFPVIKAAEIKWDPLASHVSPHKPETVVFSPELVRSALIDSDGTLIRDHPEKGVQDRICDDLERRYGARPLSFKLVSPDPEKLVAADQEKLGLEKEAQVQKQSRGRG